MLNILEGYPLRKLGWGSAMALHDEIESMRHAYADRGTLLGDPAFVKNPVARLIDRGALRPIVGAEFPLADALLAYRHKPPLGKVVLRMGDAECKG